MEQRTIDRSPPQSPDRAVTVKPPPSGEEHVNPWPFIWTLFAFKLVTLVATWWFAIRSSETNAVLGATHWFWVIIPLVAVSGPFLYQWRVRRVRRKRARLQAAEWMVDELR